MHGAGYRRLPEAGREAGDIRVHTKTVAAKHPLASRTPGAGRLGRLYSTPVVSWGRRTPGASPSDHSPPPRAEPGAATVPSAPVHRANKAPALTGRSRSSFSALAHQFLLLLEIQAWGARPGNAGGYPPPKLVQRRCRLSPSQRPRPRPCCLRALGLNLQTSFSSSRPGRGV